MRDSLTPTLPPAERVTLPLPLPLHQAVSTLLAEPLVDRSPEALRRLAAGYRAAANVLRAACPIESGDLAGEAFAKAYIELAVATERRAVAAAHAQARPRLQLARSIG